MYINQRENTKGTSTYIFFIYENIQVYHTFWAKLFGSTLQDKKQKNSGK